MRTTEEKRVYEREYHARLKRAASGPKRAAYLAKLEQSRMNRARWRAANPEENRRKALMYYYERPARQLRQKEKAWRLRGAKPPTRVTPENCECCGQKPNGKWKTLNLDHCHVTGDFRGWLCHNCNVGIGALGDQMPGVMKAAAYLLRCGTHADLIGTLPSAD